LKRTSLAELAWIGLPFAIFLAVLVHLWTNAPVWDDYDVVLGLFLRADQLHTTREWIAMIFGQHNEHRIAVMRATTLLLQKSMGEIDFRLLILAGDLTLLGTYLFVWREFRDAVSPPLAAAAGFLMFQWSYYEASLMASAALAHLAAVFFAFGCIFFAMRPSRMAIALSILFGALAASSQANGVLALPIAAAGCALWRRPRAAVVLGACAVLAWFLYFHGYVKPGQHPSLLAALATPVQAVHLFCVMVGAILPGTQASALLGAALLALIAWGAWKGLWRERPAATLWVVFVLAAAASAVVGRVGFGVLNAPRYAILSTSLVVVLAMWTFSRWRPARRGVVALVVLGAAAFSFALSAAIWNYVAEYALRPRVLREAVPASADFRVDRYGGVFYPDAARGVSLLTDTQAKGYYKPPRHVVYRPDIVAGTSVQAQRVMGHADVSAAGAHVTVLAWSDITAEVPGRTVRIVSNPAFWRVAEIYVMSRHDVAFALKDSTLVYSGFQLDLEFDSDEQARMAAANLCVVVEAPGHPATRLTTAACPS
jgi:hypothetical protein